MRGGSYQPRYDIVNLTIVHDSTENPYGTILSVHAWNIGKFYYRNYPYLLSVYQLRHWYKFGISYIYIKYECDCRLSSWS